MRTLWVFLLSMSMACREHHPPLTIDECLPYELQCATCSLEGDRSRSGTLRDYRCERADGTQLDALAERAEEGVQAYDIRYFDVESGERLASHRNHDEKINVCGTETRNEYWGEIVDDCEPICEWEALPDSDESLPEC